jgi:hypothetical protein
MLICAVLFCKIVGLSHVDGSSLRCLNYSFESTDGIHVWANGTVPFSHGIWSESTFAAWGIPICTDFSFMEVADTFREGFLLSFSRLDLPIDTVVLSMRGGDVLRPGNGWTNYWQPPCYFYTDVQRRFKHSIVIASDRTNPCVDVVIGSGSLFSGGDFRTDFTLLVWARNAVLGRSSYARAGLYMTGVSKNFYVFEGDPDSINSRWNSFFYRYLEHGDHWDCRASDGYRARIIGNWSAASDQLQFLLTDTCTWTRARVRDRISWVALPPSRHDVGLGWFVTM